MAAIESTARQHRNQSTASTHHLSPAGAASPSGARLGHILGSRYRLERLLGKGAMGEVYRAMDLQRGEPCAVKLVLPDANWTLQAQRRLVQEVKVISRLYHPNVVEVRDFFQDNDGTYLVMELLHGVDLLSLIRTQGQLPLWRALEIIRSVGSALQYAHEMGIIHRDVSASNIFLAQQTTKSQRVTETVKVLDFGLAKLIEDYQTDSKHSGGPITKGIVVGTPAYLPPEAVQKNPDLRDPRSDQWSLGVVLFHMLGGRLPFDQSHPYQLYSAICFEPPPPLRDLAPNLPEHIYAAVDKALSKSRDDRFASVKDFLRALDALPPLPTRIDEFPMGEERHSASPSPSTIELSRRITPPELPSLATDSDGPQSDTVRDLPALSQEHQKTVQYSVDELRLLAERSRGNFDAIPAPVQEDAITTRYLSSSLLTEDHAERSLREQRSTGDTVSLSAAEVASIGLPGLTRKSQAGQQTETEADGNGPARILSMPHQAGQDSHRQGAQSLSPENVSAQVPQRSPDALEESQSAPSFRLASQAVWSWLKSERLRTVRSNLLMMGIGVALCLLCAWALGLLRSSAPHDELHRDHSSAQRKNGLQVPADDEEQADERIQGAPTVRTNKNGGSLAPSAYKGIQVSGRTAGGR